jgi:CRP/FNR family transcriptional regulator, anaerobic regulatory protein
MEPVISQLKNLLTSEELLLFKKNTKEENFKDGTCIIQASSREKVYFVKTGSIRIFRISEQGKEITLYRIGTGELCLLSLNAILAPLQFNSTAVVEGNTSLLSIPYTVYSTLFTKNIKFQHYVMGMMMTVLNSVMMLSEEIAFHSINKRICAKILDIQQTQGSHILKTTHEEIANDLGTAREVVSRALKTLTYEGIIIKTRGRLEILDENKLKNMSAT